MKAFINVFLLILYQLLLKRHAKDKPQKCFLPLDFVTLFHDVPLTHFSQSPCYRLNVCLQNSYVKILMPNVWY